MGQVNEKKHVNMVAFYPTIQQRYGKPDRGCIDRTLYQSTK